MAATSTPTTAVVVRAVAYLNAAGYDCVLPPSGGRVAVRHRGLVVAELGSTDGGDLTITRPGEEPDAVASNRAALARIDAWVGIARP